MTLLVFVSALGERNGPTRMAITNGPDGIWVCLKPEGLNVPGHPSRLAQKRVLTCIPQR